MARNTRTRKDLDALNVDSPTFGEDYNRLYHAIMHEIQAAHAAVCAAARRDRLEDNAVAAWQSVKARYGESLLECALEHGNY